MAEYIYSMVRARKAVGDKVILDDVTMAFLPGAKIGVLGPNGAGKSTILKIMAGLDQPSNGEAGHDLEDRRLPRAVGSDDADLGAGQEVQRDVVEDDLVAVRLARLVHGVDELSHWLFVRLGCSGRCPPRPEPRARTLLTGSRDAIGRARATRTGRSAPSGCRCPSLGDQRTAA